MRSVCTAVKAMVVPITAGMTLLFCFAACQDPPKPVKATSHIRMTDEKMITYHRGIVRSEEQEIADFIARHQWTMMTTPTGLRYMIYQKNSGQPVRPGWKVSFIYEIRLLTGALICSSDSTGTKAVVLGRGETERGLEEGLLLMRVGEKAKFVLPSYLAYGLLGDQDRIPPGAVLVYDIQLIDLQQVNK